MTRVEGVKNRPKLRDVIYGRFRVICRFIPCVCMRKPTYHARQFHCRSRILYRIKGVASIFNLMSHAEASKLRAGRQAHTCTRKLVDANAVIEIEKTHVGLHLHKQRFG